MSLIEAATNFLCKYNSLSLLLAGPVLRYKRLLQIPLHAILLFHSNLGEFVALVAKSSQANNVAIPLASLEGLTSESKLSTVPTIAKGLFKTPNNDFSVIISISQNKGNT